MGDSNEVTNSTFPTCRKKKFGRSSGQLCRTYVRMSIDALIYSFLAFQYTGTTKTFFFKEVIMLSDKIRFDFVSDNWRQIQKRLPRN